MLSLVGRSGVGKTTLLELALIQLRASGKTALACKHSHHDLADLAGSDSHRLTQAGAQGVVLLGQKSLHLFGHGLSLERLLPLLAADYEVALVEGGKGSSLPKVELLGGEAPMLGPDLVIEHLRRGQDAGDQTPVRRFLEILDSHGADIAP